MQLGRILGAAVGAGLLVLTTPGAAFAATGEFNYRYLDGDGETQIGYLFDPPSKVCITLPEVADAVSTDPAFSPRNRTDATAVAFTGLDCTGQYFSMKPVTGYGSERLKLRSVLFS